MKTARHRPAGPVRMRRQGLICPTVPSQPGQVIG